MPRRNRVRRTKPLGTRRRGPAASEQLQKQIRARLLKAVADNDETAGRYEKLAKAYGSGPVVIDKLTGNVRGTKHAKAEHKRLKRLALHARNLAAEFRGKLIALEDKWRELTHKDSGSGSKKGSDSPSTCSDTTAPSRKASGTATSFFSRLKGVLIRWLSWLRRERSDHQGALSH